jgi:hypothetical protein
LPEPLPLKQLKLPGRFWDLFSSSLYLSLSTKRPLYNHAHEGLECEETAQHKIKVGGQYALFASFSITKMLLPHSHSKQRINYTPPPANKKERFFLQR